MRAVGSYLLHSGRGRYQASVGRYSPASFPSATVALLRMSSRLDPSVAWSEARQSFESLSPVQGFRNCRRYALHSPLERQEVPLVEVVVAEALEAAADFLGNLDAVDHVFA